MSSLALLAMALFIIALFLGRLTRISIGRLTLPPTGLALVYWIGVGGHSQTYELDRAALLVITGMIGALFVFVWLAGAVVGRLMRNDDDRYFDPR